MYTCMQIHTPTTTTNPPPPPALPRVFDMLQYSEMILVESIWSPLQDEIYFMGGGAAGGLWRHQQWSPPWPPSWILPRIRNQVKTTRNGDFFVVDMKNNT